MSIQDYVARVVEMNEYLPLMPEIGGKEPDKLPEDELLELLEFSLPEKWQVAMLLQDFDPADHSLEEFVAFCTRLEMAYDDTSKEGCDRDDTERALQKRKAKRKRDRKDSDSEEEPGCVMHGPKSVCGHVTRQCRAIKKQAKSQERKYRKSSKWNSKKRQHKHFSKEEVKALFERMYNHSAKKRAVDRKKTQDELRVFENLKVESDNEKDRNPFESSDEESERSNSSDSRNSA